ncbi:MAG: acyl-[acyl-carrier-protein]--UDP-N-acetylglucosamine O-acyltransferase [Candidatus Schekmanbacteria bacterium RBG_13_48_7]|uniref:Acyl-[acyl-carrier-protein]--UDP-N-acetylglucosamine O-acyltransferase n=1 Tax=Candidatus Schekmanbacteria bacterium RBG_13_48_7 TaxID=1817878 RepID=A0A1F7RJC2_9BACT|nr:MAG: acyl-[acyl-carrier-protein]--UDP-N-acetylglucosamine O-acyltransferase [Candidatus Schekmanbacteria bacterium RBG_13_48_7]
MDDLVDSGTKIAPSAHVSNKAEIGNGSTIEHGAVIGEKVRIGPNVRIGAYTVIEGRTTIGNNCNISHHCCLGAPPQDLKYKGEDTELFIGDNNVIREFATIHLGTATGHGKTVVGNNCFLMAYIHIAHDCSVGSNVIMANAATLAGHIEVHDNAILGGLTAVHQFTRIGKLAIVGGCSAVSQDVLPFSKVAGNHAMTYGLNSIGLRRAGFSSESILILKKAFRLFFSSKLPRKEALDTIQKEFGHLQEIAYFLSFIKSSKRGVCKKVR